MYIEQILKSIGQIAGLLASAKNGEPPLQNIGLDEQSSARTLSLIAMCNSFITFFIYMVVSASVAAESIEAPEEVDIAGE